MAAAMSSQSLNLGSPRVRAAMRVLGVHPRDVEQQDAAAFDGTQRQLQLMEKKRETLVAQVTSLAARGGEVTHKSVQNMASDEDPNAAFLAEVERVEAENFARLKKMAKKEVQSVVIAELDAKVAAQKAEQKQEESRQRMHDLLKQRNALLRAQKKEGEKKQEKSREVRIRSDKAKLDKSQKLGAEIAAAQERSVNKLQEIADSRVDGRIKNAEKMQRISEKVERNEAELFHKREKQYEEQCERHDEKIAKLAEILAQRQSNAEAIFAKQQESMQKVRSHQELKQAQVEKKYWEICDRHDSAQKVREDALAAKRKFYRDGNKKAFTSHESRWDRIKKELENEQNKAVRAAMERFSGTEEANRSTQIFGRSISESKLQEVVEGRAAHVELAHQNRERNRRAHHYALEQRLSKLQANRDRIHVMEDAKMTADQRRMAVMRNCALEKHHLEHQVNRIKDCQNPETMSKLLENLDPEPEAISRINELLGELGMASFGAKEGEEEGK